VAQAVDTRVEAFRSEFPMTRKLAYLNHASYGPFPTRTVEAVKAYAEGFADPTAFFKRDRGTDDLAAEVRAMVAEMAGARPEMVAFVPSLADGINLLVNGLDYRPGDNVLIPAEEFPSNVYPLLNLERHGVEVRFVPKDDARHTDIARIEAAMDGRTRALVISHVEYMDGYRNDLYALGALCKARGVELFVDVTQSLCAQPVDVEGSGVSAVVAHGYKWLMSSFGIGVCVFAADALERIHVTYAGRLSVTAGFEDQDYKLNWREDASRFQTGGLNTLGLTAMHASLSLIREAGPVWTAEHTGMLNDRLSAGLHERGYQIPSSLDPAHRSQILAFSSGDRGRDAQIVDELERANVSVCLRGRGVRVSPYFYNTVEDVDRLLEGLRAEG
jgi:selenocysteine lyase/cysteine desulfurase